MITPARRTSPIEKNKNTCKGKLDKRDHKSYIPYIQRERDRTARRFEENGICSSLKPLSKMKTILRTIKDKQPSTQKPGVKNKFCTCGGVYISQTGRHTSARVKENIEDTRKEIQRNTVAEHPTEPKHDI